MTNSVNKFEIHRDRNLYIDASSFRDTFSNDSWNEYEFIWKMVGKDSEKFPNLSYLVLSPMKRSTLGIRDAGKEF